MKTTLAASIIFVVIAIAVIFAVNHKSHNSNNSYTSPPSSNNSNSSSSSSSASQGAVTITNNMIFTPSQISVSVGSTVTWTNNDNTTHTVIDDLANVGGPHSGDIAPGATYSYKFTKAGSYQYHCSIHPQMRGTIVVK